MREIYSRFGYEVIEVPKTMVEERAEFFLEKIGL